MKIYPDDYGNMIVKLYKRDEGIEWRLRSDVWDESFRDTVCVVGVKVNPKILGGVIDYITAANMCDMNVAIVNFNDISKRISPLLGTFENYVIRRVDYCVNFSLNELAPGCTCEQMMKVIKRANIPPHYTEWMSYDETAHRKKSKPGSFYLVCKSANINCYSKYMKLLEQSKENIAKGYPPVSPEIMEAARDIIRFEVQYKYPRTYVLSRRIRTVDGRSKQPQEDKSHVINLYRDLLDRRTCEETVKAYYNKTIGSGDWFTLQAAIQKVESRGFNKQKENRLILALQEVSQCRSLASAKAKYQGSDLGAFKRTLKDLTDIGINPVTIPRDWGISRIPNLLGRYNALSGSGISYASMQLIECALRAANEL